MLFGMLKEKEIIESTSSNTSRNDIVDDFGGVGNNQNMVQLTSFSGSHSEDINYQSIDLNNPQTIINSINNIPQNNTPNNIYPMNNPQDFNNIPTSNIPNNINQNYQPANMPMQNNYPYPNGIPINNQPMMNPNMQGYGVNPNVNIQSMPQNSPNSAPVQFYPINTSVMNNNQMNPQPIVAPVNAINGNVSNMPGSNAQPVQQNVNTINSNVLNEQNNPNITDKPNNINNEEFPESPVQILTEVPEKGGKSSLTSALLSAAPTQPITNEQNINTIGTPMPIEVPNNVYNQPNNDISISQQLPQQNEIQQINNEVNNQSIELPKLEVNSNLDSNIETTKSIDDEIKNVPIPSLISLTPNIDDNNSNVENQEQTIELPPLPEVSNNVEQNNMEVTKEEINENKVEEEHKFIINDNVDVEQGFKICPKCGQKIRDDYRLCFVCGTYF